MSKTINQETIKVKVFDLEKHREGDELPIPAETSITITTSTIGFIRKYFLQFRGFKQLQVNLGLVAN